MIGVTSRAQKSWRRSRTARSSSVSNSSERYRSVGEDMRRDATRIPEGVTEGPAPTAPGRRLADAGRTADRDDARRAGRGRAGGAGEDGELRVAAGGCARYASVRRASA